MTSPGYAPVFTFLAIVATCWILALCLREMWRRAALPPPLTAAEWAKGLTAEELARRVGSPGDHDAEEMAALRAEAKARLVAMLPKVSDHTLFRSRMTADESMMSAINAEIDRRMKAKYNANKFEKHRAS